MYDIDNQVAVEAADVLDEACEDEVSLAGAEGLKVEYLGGYQNEDVVFQILPTNVKQLYGNL